MTARTGIILAGGRSIRFGGGNKALAELEGRPVIRRVAEVVGDVVDELVVNCRSDQVQNIRQALSGVAREPRFALDEIPDRGPVAGMAKALRISSAPTAVVTACDMPFLDPSFLDSLFDEAEGEPGAVPVYDGCPQPLCAAYSVDETGRTCHAVLASDENALQDVIACLEPVIIPEEAVRSRTHASTFINVNTRDKLHAIRRGDRPHGI